MRRPWFNSWVGKIHWRRDRLPTPVVLGFPGDSDGKESTYNVRVFGFDPCIGKISWRRERLPTPVFWSGEFHGLYIVHGVTKSQTQLNDFNSLAYLSDYYKKQNKANFSITLYILPLLSGEGWDGGRKETIVSAVYLSKTFSVFAQT